MYPNFELFCNVLFCVGYRPEEEETRQNSQLNQSAQSFEMIDAAWSMC